ncbi:M48 family metallopeptidase [Agarivorans albus]|uniref:Zn-dependent protease with chaperone function n=1 Tax=Agarivorans albus MKT 106 TaxID=1331007 RepID=R9PIN4_AGAAL|nr:M48 family metallopeptidase [Agarivorans albus]GAD01215.1 zn-dependent protease with chaperone function [Agarivorans albus MKT 106]
MIITGKVFVENSSVSRAAKLHCSDEGWLELSDEFSAIRAPLSELDIAMSIGSQARAIGFSNGSRFVADEPSRLNSWLDKQGQGSWLKTLERNVFMIILAFVVSGAAIYAAASQGLPWLSHYLAGKVPVSISQELGERTLQQFETLGFSETEINPEQRQAIEQNFNSLVEQIDSLPMQPKLYFYRMGEDANAFALADGSIVVTDQLVKLLDSPEQLNGILLHELAHVAHNDVMASLVRSALISTAVVLVVGDTSILVDGLVSAAVLGVSLGYSREAEQQADLFACHWSKQLDLPQDQLLAGYQHLFEDHESHIPTWISSHPGDEDRLKQLSNCLN